MRRALGLYDTAPSLDPGYADPHAGRATAFNRLIRMGAAMPGSEEAGEAIAAARRAVEFDPSPPRACFALSTCHQLAGNSALALSEARLAVELNPNDPVLLLA